MALKKVSETVQQSDYRGLPEGVASISRINLYLGCQRKWYHQYVARTPRDYDAQFDALHLNIGKAFHKCLEDSNHLPYVGSKWYEKIGRSLCLEYRFDGFEAAKILAMLIEYKDAHIKSGLIPISNELQVSDDKLGGYVDAIMLDEKRGGYWFVDMKTASSLQAGLRQKLPHDQQLCTYVKLAESALEQTPQLKGKRCLGALYRVTLKPSIARKKEKEKFWDIVARCTTAVHDYYIPYENMQLDSVRSVLESLCTQLITKTAKGCIEECVPNYGNCMAYNTPCVYWSQCHGKAHTEARQLVEHVDYSKPEPVIDVDPIDDFDDDLM